MLSEKIKTIRKNKGYTQEELATRLHVTRQTISKWEKGYSVPDAAMLTDMAEVLEVSVVDLLGAEKIDPEQSDAIVDQLSRINEQLTVKNRRSKRIWKGIIIFAVIFLVVIPLLLTVPNMVIMNGATGGNAGFKGLTEWVYELNGQEYECTVKYDKNYNIVSLSSDGDAEIEEELKLDSCRDANEVKDKIESYFDDQGAEPIHIETKGLELKE